MTFVTLLLGFLRFAKGLRLAQILEALTMGLYSLETLALAFPI